MLSTPTRPKNRFWFLVNPRHAMVTLLLAACASVALAQNCKVTDPAETPPPNPPYTYPMTSDQYAVQYSLNGGPWRDVRVYISYYGATYASPYLSYSGYARLVTSMSFVSIPADVDTWVQLRVTKLSSPFKAIDQVSVRPSVKFVGVGLALDGTAQLATFTGPDFAGEQFILWWGNSTQGAAIDGLAFFLDKPYTRPTGPTVKTIYSNADLEDVSGYDALDFEETVAIGSTTPGAQAYAVPVNINNIFLGPNAWVQGKLNFIQSGMGNQRKIYGPGVLDVSRFNFDDRVCPTDQGLNAISWQTSPTLTNDTFMVDGIIISDHNHAAIDLLGNGAVNNMKTISWNAVNGGLRIGDNTTVSNVFVRSGDDSLMVWGRHFTVTNATVWQNYNGGVVNLGWWKNSPGNRGMIDGLFVVKTDWYKPSNPTWCADPKDLIAYQNNAVIASMQVPGTDFGSMPMQTPVFRNIFVEDPPQVLFSLKIVPPVCNLIGLDGSCPGKVTLTDSSTLDLTIENLFTPPSAVQNSIGFQILPPGSKKCNTSSYTLTGKMSINLTNVFIKMPDGTFQLLTSQNAWTLGQVSTNGSNVNVNYGFVP
jgi:hypothetical protein